MKSKPSYDKTLTILLMIFLLLPMLQGWLQLIPLKPLTGVTVKTEKPEFSFEAYRSGDYAQQEEAYLGENFGFRESAIRLYNQYLWTCYKKTYAHDVVAGKDSWLYYPQSVSDYYGTELLKWQPSVEEAKRNFDQEVKYLNWARTILKENGTELLVFMAPEKGFLYPEHLPDEEHDTTTFNAREYFEEKFIETDFPCIEMTRWFLQMKDTVGYPLLPQAGAHWVFPAVYAADSLFRFMGSLKDTELPRIKIGELHESHVHGMDNDLEHQLNLMLPLNHRYGFCPRAEVSIESDSSRVKPRVLFIGNSFMWNIAYFVPLEEVFDEVEFWYYFSTAYYGKDLKQTALVGDLNLLEKLLDFDYIVWFTTGNQMNKGTSGFAKTAIIHLCVSDSLLKNNIKHLSDSLPLSTWEARTMLFEHPELIPELRGDSLRIRNSEIPYAKIIKDIRKDSSWMAALEAQGFLRSATLKMMLHAEAGRIMQDKPLYRDQADEIRFSISCQQEAKELEKVIPNNEQWMLRIREYANKSNITIEKALEDASIWSIKEKYKLDHCRLTDDPDAEIPLPLDFQLK